MLEYLTLGSVPCDESCAQVGCDNYYAIAMAECRRYRELLETKFPGFKDAGCKFSIKGFRHEFGTYHEVVIYYDHGIDLSIDFAFFVERNTPVTWSDDAILATFVRTGNWDHLRGYKYPENDPYL